MRRETGSTFRSIATAAMTVALAAGPWAAAWAAPDAVTLRAVEIDGARVHLLVANTGIAARTVSITVEAALVSGRTAVAVAEVTVPPGSTTEATVPMEDAVRNVTAVGIVLDDGVPF